MAVFLGSQGNLRISQTVAQCLYPGIPGVSSLHFSIVLLVKERLMSADKQTDR